jgi:hypothetical protein
MGDPATLVYYLYQKLQYEGASLLEKNTKFKHPEKEIEGLCACCRVPFSSKCLCYVALCRLIGITNTSVSFSQKSLIDTYTDFFDSFKKENKTMISYKFMLPMTCNEGQSFPHYFGTSKLHKKGTPSIHLLSKLLNRKKEVMIHPNHAQLQG